MQYIVLSDSDGRKRIFFLSELATVNMAVDCKKFESKSVPLDLLEGTKTGKKKKRINLSLLKGRLWHLENYRPKTPQPEMSINYGVGGP